MRWRWRRRKERKKERKEWEEKRLACLTVKLLPALLPLGSADDQCLQFRSIELICGQIGACTKKRTLIHSEIHVEREETKKRKKKKICVNKKMCAIAHSPMLLTLHIYFIRYQIKSERCINIRPLLWHRHLCCQLGSKLMMMGSPYFRETIQS